MHINPLFEVLLVQVGEGVGETVVQFIQQVLNVLL
jgi:hypothetical protein